MKLAPASSAAVLRSSTAVKKSSSTATLWVVTACATCTAASRLKSGLSASIRPNIAMSAAVSARLRTSSGVTTIISPASFRSARVVASARSSGPMKASCARARRGEVVLLLFLGALLACGFDFSEYPRDFSSDRIRFFGRGAFRQQMLFDFFSETLGSLSQMTVERAPETLARADGALERLRGNAQSLDAAHQGGLGAPCVVAVEIRRGIELQPMQLDETGHADVS